MISRITGEVVAGPAGTISISTNGGVTYTVKTTDSADKVMRSSLGHRVTIYTHQIFREDGIHTYGFLSEPDVEMFRHIIRIKGVGAAIALACLSSFGPMDFSLAITNEDIGEITAIPGIGKVLAQKLIKELKPVLE